MLRMPNPARKMAQVPGFSLEDELAAAIRARTDDAARRHDRFPRAPRPPMLGIVVEQPLLRLAAGELVRDRTEPLIRHSRNKPAATEVTRPRRIRQPGRQPRTRPPFPLRARPRAIA